MPITPQQRYTNLVGTLLDNPDVTQSEKRGFGSGLRVGGKVFAMLVKGQLVVKLPQPRIAEMIAKGEGEPYHYGNGRVTKGWLTVQETSEEEWLPLAREAMEFVAAKED